MPAQAMDNRDFYQRQIDKLSYSADDYLKAAARPHWPSRQSQLNDRIDTQIGDGVDEPGHDVQEILIVPPIELIQPSASQEVLIERGADVAQRKSRVILLAHKAMRRKEPRTDPYQIVTAAKNKGNTFKLQGASFKRPEMPSIGQLSTKILQLRTRVAATVTQQSGRFRTTLTSEQDQLQKFSSKQLERRRQSLESWVERVIKTPLRQVFKKIETLSHQVVKRLS